MEPGEKKIQLFDGKRGWSAATEKNGFQAATGHFAKAPLEVQQDGIQESLSLISVGSFFVKATIGANLRTKRNVDVEVMQLSLNSVLDLHEGEYNAASCSEQ